MTTATQPQTGLIILIPQDPTLVELCRIRFDMEQDCNDDPEAWKQLARLFWQKAAVANAERCEAKAKYYQNIGAF